MPGAWSIAGLLHLKKLQEHAVQSLYTVWCGQRQEDMRQEKKKVFGRVDLYCCSLAKYIWGKQEWPFWIIPCIYYPACGREECFRKACCTVSCNSPCTVCMCWRAHSCRRAQGDYSHFFPPWDLSFWKHLLTGAPGVMQTNLSPWCLIIHYEERWLRHEAVIQIAAEAFMTLI